MLKKRYLIYRKVKKRPPNSETENQYNKRSDMENNKIKYSLITTTFQIKILFWNPGIYLF